MLLQRWDPFREMISLREAMDRLIRDGFVGSGNWLPASGGQSVAFDVHESEDAYVLKAELPGVKPDQTEILVQGNTVTIRGERKADEERQEKGYLLREHQYGAFRRALTLPVAINADQAEAQFENGVLTLTLPKAEEAKPKAIKVSSQNQLASGQPGSTQEHSQTAPTAQPEHANAATS